LVIIAETLVPIPLKTFNTQRAIKFFSLLITAVKATFNAGNHYLHPNEEDKSPFDEDHVVISTNGEARFRNLKLVSLTPTLKMAGYRDLTNFIAKLHADLWVPVTDGLDTY
jgi:hypothetical protein